ncbi:MAG: NRDE family protein [Halioglobus sp.]|nr:NRDE family protein [Halioglobus sp.]
MCLLILAHQVSPDYPFLVAANRDEFHARPTAASQFWPEHPGLLAGRDLLQGGTWMGMTRSGRFAAVTNYRDQAHTPAPPRSRGDLPLQYLTGSQTPKNFLHDIAVRAGDYAGFNLLIGDRNSLWHYTNSDAKDPQHLPPGIYGLSNANLDTPWPKVTLGKAKLLALLKTGAISHRTLSEVVSSQCLADRSSLSAQGLDSSMESTLSPQFIITDTYGTRSSTTLWFDAHAQANWLELSFNAQGVLCEEQHQEINLNDGPYSADSKGGQ